MRNILGLKKSLIDKNKAAKFIFYEFIIIISFAFAYWLSDIFMAKYPKLATKLHLGEIHQADSFYSYLYFSLITQTIVGYGGTLPDGGSVLSTKSIPLRLLVGLQLFSIVLITGWTLL